MAKANTHVNICEKHYNQLKEMQLFSSTFNTKEHKHSHGNTEQSKQPKLL